MQSEIDDGARIILKVSGSQNEFLKQTVKKGGYLSRQAAIRDMISRQMEEATV